MKLPQSAQYDEVKYLVFDVESVPDPKLIKMVRYPGEDLDDRAAVAKYRDEILEATEGVSEFIPVTFQYPVSVTVAKVRDDYTLIDIVCLDDPKFRPRELSRLFWLGVESYPPQRVDADGYRHARLARAGVPKGQRLLAARRGRRRRGGPATVRRAIGRGIGLHGPGSH